jgi:hypothetical protein
MQNWELHAACKTGTAGCAFDIFAHELSVPRPPRSGETAAALDNRLTLGEASMRVILVLAAIYALIVAIDMRFNGARPEHEVVPGSTFAGSD